MNSHKLSSDGKKSSSSILSSSLILSSIDKFTAYIYSLIKNGFFGFLFTGYNNDTSTGISRKKNKTSFSTHLSELKYGFCRHIENSFIVNTVEKFTKYLLSCQLKYYGVFLMTFGIYNLLYNIFNALVKNSLRNFSLTVDVLLSIVVIFASLPLVFSRESLAKGISNSLIGSLILNITGYDSNCFGDTDRLCGRTSTSFILGFVCALVFSFSGPVWFFAAVAVLVWAYLVLVRPEIGVLTLFVFLPFIQTMLLAAIVIYTFICWILKIFRNKRVLSFEPVDIVVALFAIIVLSGGVISLSATSLKPALLMICFIMGYFLVIQLSSEREWLLRCSRGLVISGTAVSLYGIAAYYLGSGYFSQAWVDNEMFESISNRAVSTLENPNMLGEYLIIVLPIIFALVLSKGEGFRIIPSLFIMASMGICLVLTWSRGAWLAIIVAMVLFMFMWHYRSIWLVIAGILAIPVLPSVLPASIISRITSIGNMTDSSTSYRVYIWRASVQMIKDNPIAGIGIGEGAWSRIYPLYSYMGIEAAPHSHNLFIQIWLETGIFGFIAFLAIILIAFQAAFTFFRKLSLCTKIKSDELSEKMVIYNRNRSVSANEAKNASKIQLRMSIIGPLTSIIAVLAQGITDYSWYNYRLFLLFWLVLGLAIAYIKNGNKYLVTYDKD